MIPLELFNGPEMETRRKNAFAKAEKEKPVVKKVADGQDRQTYSVNQYQVDVLYGWVFIPQHIECSCAAGSPPIDPETELPARDPQPCYHSAGALLHIEKEKDASN
jgi:hypothetical protein